MNPKIEHLHQLQNQLREAMEKSQALTALLHESEALSKELEALESSESDAEANVLFSSLS